MRGCTRADAGGRGCGAGERCVRWESLSKQFLPGTWPHGRFRGKKTGGTVTMNPGTMTKRGLSKSNSGSRSLGHAGPTAEDGKVDTQGGTQMLPLTTSPRSPRNEDVVKSRC